MFETCYTPFHNLTSEHAIFHEDHMENKHEYLQYPNQNLLQIM